MRGFMEQGPEATKRQRAVPEWRRLMTYRFVEPAAATRGGPPCGEYGAMAERPRRGLQIVGRRFDSGARLVQLADVDLQYFGIHFGQSGQARSTMGVLQSSVNQWLLLAPASLLQHLVNAIPLLLVS